MSEIWKLIDGYPGYKVSNVGRVKSLARKDSRGNRIPERILNPHVTIRGYKYVSLYKNGVPKKHRIHRLVAAAFIPNPKKKEEVNHIDGNKQNNLASNLEWATRNENNDHAYKIGLNTTYGEGHHQAKLTNKQVIDIYRRIHQGENGAKLAREYGVSRTTVSDIKRGRQWSRITGRLKVNE